MCNSRHSSPIGLVIIVSRNGVCEALSIHSGPSFLPSVIPSVLPSVTRTAACIELKFGIKLEINKRRSSTFEKSGLRDSKNIKMCNSRHSSPIGLVFYTFAVLTVHSIMIENDYRILSNKRRDAYLLLDLLF